MRIGLREHGVSYVRVRGMWPDTTSRDTAPGTWNLKLQGPEIALPCSPFPVWHAVVAATTQTHLTHVARCRGQPYSGLVNRHHALLGRGPIKVEAKRTLQHILSFQVSLC